VNSSGIKAIYYDGLSTAWVAESGAVVECTVTPVNARLSAATVQAVIKVDITLGAADRCTSGVSNQPGRGERQASGQDCKHEKPSDQFRNHWSTPSAFWVRPMSVGRTHRRRWAF